MGYAPDDAEGPPRLGQLMAVARSRARSQLHWPVLGILAFALFAPAGAQAMAGPREPASVAVASPGDRAATQRLVKAGYELSKATLTRARAVNAAEARAAEALGHECGGVLRGAPYESVLEEEGPFASGPKLSGRAKGERARSEEEKQTIDGEIEETVYAAGEHVLRGPVEAFYAKTRRLTWSNPTIKAVLGQDAAQFREALIGPTVAVCSEMRTWAASGYHLLPPGSRSWNESREARTKQVVQGNLEVLLRPYENPAERATIRRTTELKERLREEERTEEILSRAEYHMELELGERLSRSDEQQLAPPIGKGRTSAGTTFVVRAGGPISPRSSCKHEVQVEVREPHGGTGSGVCLSEGAHASPSVTCSGSVETVALATPPDVRRARVRLSNGRTTTVSVVRIPAKDGGPAGVFIDTFRGYNPYPVSVQELSRGSRVVRTVSLTNVRCRKETAGAPGPPQIVTLARVTGPSGENLTISGTLVRFRRQTEFSLGPQPGMRNSEASEERGNHRQFQWNLSTECLPHPYSLLDGILEPPGAAVLVRTPAGLTQLTKVELAPSMHAEGPLFYGVYAAAPTEIVVERSDGSVLYTENLAAKATEETEFCEGFGER